MIKQVPPRYFVLMREFNEFMARGQWKKAAQWMDAIEALLHE